jgi:sugar lactone lactonase YvrE
LLALIYLILAFVLGDSICRRFFIFTSLAHRIAAALLSGLLISSWATYFFAYIFAATGSPMLWGNAAFFVLSIASIFLLEWRPDLTLRKDASATSEFVRWDWIFVGIFVIVASWMMFSTFSATGDRLQIGNHEWSDFGSNVSVMRSFSVGNNFPTEYPHFSGDRIRYHFLFYFLAGNIEYLGLNPAVANNVLSILTLIAMLMLVMTLGMVLFGSRVVGRIGAVLFFFHGTLAYIPFVAGTATWSSAFSKIWEMKGFLPSGLPYRGEDWGVWTQVVYLNQRHLASSIGLLLLVMIFLLLRARIVFEERSVPVGEFAGLSSDSSEIQDAIPEIRGYYYRFAPYIFAGCLLGMMPMWNGAVFTGAAAVIGALLLVLPIRKEMLLMGIVAGLLALPQIIYLKQGAKEPPYSLFHWGYTVDDPTLANVAYYLFFTFGLKWILIVAAVVWGSSLQRKVMVALCSLLILTFCFQFSEELLANHKFLNIWLVVANLYAAYGLQRLWKLRLGPLTMPSRLAAVALVLFIVIGGVIDLVVIKNIYWVEARYDGDPLVEWVKQNTDPRAIFLSNRYVSHGILMAGRRLFYGHPYYAWGAGYPTTERDQIYKKMFESRDPAEVYRLIKENGITHVAIDDALRKNDFVHNLNEPLFARYFPLVFEDTEKQYDGMKIYLVPGDLDLPVSAEPEPAMQVTAAANALEGGEGSAGGQFSKPRGITADKSGNIYVADTGNSRVQKFSPDGIFIMSFGIPGAGTGQLKEPNGVAVAEDGTVYVVDALNHKLLRYNSSGTFDREWSGPETGFYGPRDIVLSPEGRLYIVDQGRTRIVRFDPTVETFSTWGSAGSDPGQFAEPTGIEYGGGLLYVADLGNDRVQAFDLDGNFVRMWEIPEWGKYPWHFPDVAFDQGGGRLFVTNGWKDELIVLNADGGRADFRPERAPSLSNPSSVVLVRNSSGTKLLVLNTTGARVESVRIQGK